MFSILESSRTTRVGLSPMIKLGFGEAKYFSRISLGDLNVVGVESRYGHAGFSRVDVFRVEGVLWVVT